MMGTMRAPLLVVVVLVLAACRASARSGNEARNHAQNILRGHLRAPGQHLGLMTLDEKSSRQLPTTSNAFDREAATPVALGSANTVDAAAAAIHDDALADYTQYVEFERRYILPPKPTAASSLQNSTPGDVRPPPPHIRDTIKTLRSLFDAVLQHPLRYSWLSTTFVLGLLWRVARFILGFAWILMRPFIIPFYIAVVLPSSFFASVFGELQPLITFFLSASLLGLLIGIVAGLWNGLVSDYITQVPQVAPVASRLRRPAPTYGMSYLDSPSRRRRRQQQQQQQRSTANVEFDDEGDADVDAEFRASLRFPPLPPPYGSKPRSSDSESETDGDADHDETDTGPPTPRAGSPVTMRPDGPSSGLRRRISSGGGGTQPLSATASSSSTTSSSSSSMRPMPPSALLSPVNERPPRTPKAVRWES